MMNIEIQPSTVYISISDAQLQNGVSELKDVVLSIKTLPASIKRSLNSKEKVTCILNDLRLSE